MIRMILAVVCLGAFCVADTQADCHRRAIVVRNRVVVVEQRLATFIPLVVPAYSITYSDSSLVLAQKIEELRLAVEGHVKQKALMPSCPVGAAAPDEDQHMDFLRQQCAACHEAGVAKAKGAGFVMFKGADLVDLSERDARKVLVQVMTGAMPKGRPLTDDGKRLIAELFDPE